MSPMAPLLSWRSSATNRRSVAPLSIEIVELLVIRSSKTTIVASPVTMMFESVMVRSSSLTIVTLPSMVNVDWFMLMTENRESMLNVSDSLLNVREL